MEKNNIDFSWFKKLNTANISPSINPNLQSLFKDPELTQKEILNFLKESNQKQFEVAELQSKTAEKQFINNKRLTIIALIFAFISIIPIILENIPIFQTKKSVENRYELENKILFQSNAILENQVKILKLQNDIILEKLKNEN